MRLSRTMAAVMRPRTTLSVWSDGYEDALARRNPANSYPRGSELSGAYERGYLAGLLARGFETEAA